MPGRHFHSLLSLLDDPGLLRQRLFKERGRRRKQPKPGGFPNAEAAVFHLHEEGQQRAQRLRRQHRVRRRGGAGGRSWRRRRPPVGDGQGRDAQEEEEQELPQLAQR